MGPLGLPLFSEGSHAFFLVIGGKEALEDAALVEETLSKAKLLSLVDALLGHRDGRGRLLCDFRANLDSLRNEVFNLDDTRDKTAIGSLLSIHHVTG